MTLTIHRWVVHILMVLLNVLESNGWDPNPPKRGHGLDTQKIERIYAFACYESKKLDYVFLLNDIVSFKNKVFIQVVRHDAIGEVFGFIRKHMCLHGKASS